MEKTIKYKVNVNCAILMRLRSNRINSLFMFQIICSVEQDQ